MDWDESDHEANPLATRVADLSPAASPAVVVVMGYARLPQVLASRQEAAVVAVELAVDPGDSRIIDANFEGVPALGQRVLRAALLGHRLDDGPGAILEEIGRCYICPSQRAVCTAVAHAHEVYRRYRTRSDLTWDPIGAAGRPMGR